MKKFIKELSDKILDGYVINEEEAFKIINIEENDEDTIEVLLQYSNDIRKKFAGNKADLCSIMNGKSGRCSEDCKYCAQSAHYNTNVCEYALINYEDVLERAKEVQAQGIHRFSLVTSGRGIESDEELESLIKIYSGLKRDTNLKLCASHGIINYDQAMRLKESGISMYHHNVETSERYYGDICTTHTYEDRVNTINDIKEAGLDLCCGGILGLGEKREDRVKMAFEIRGLGVKSVPLNVLNPIKGTPLGENPLLVPNEILKTMALFRFVIPDSYIRYAGGRIALGDKQHKGFSGGVNAALTGNYLTTVGSNVDNDKDMITCSGLEI